MTTLVALFIGVFVIGLILALGIGIRDNINSLLSTGTTYNSFILVNAPDKAAVDRRAEPGLGHQGKLVNTTALANPVSVDGRPIGPIIRGRYARRLRHSAEPGRADLLSQPAGRI